jgi:hypothetical protein
MIVECKFPGVVFTFSSLDAVVTTYFPDGTPAQMQRISIHEFIRIGKEIIAEKENAVSR